MDLLAAGMGVDPPSLEGSDDGAGVGIESLRGSSQRKNVLTPGSAEEWIARQGHEGILRC